MTKSKAILSLTAGEPVQVDGADCVITHIVGLDEVLVRNKATGEIRQVKIRRLQAPGGLQQTKPLEGFSEESLKKAQEYLDTIQPLIGLSGRTRADVEKRAKEVGCHPTSLYVRLREYEGSGGLLSSLVPKERKDKGAKRLDPEIEAIVNGVLDEEYLKPQRRTPVIVYREIVRRCRAGKLTAPHINTLRNRIRGLPAQTVVARRYGKKKADHAFSPNEGSFPGATHPLAVVQIDHTKLDIILVDERHRREIGRPWITLAIDVFSRMILGFYISFDPSGALSTGLCISHAILPKENYLARLGVEGEWPCFGKPDTIHVDNAKEFRGKMLETACRQYGINIEWRPVARPHFGGTVERAYRTLLQETHALPGTTFSNPSKRGDYDSAAKAALTLPEFEKWLATFIVEAYHNKVHTSLGMSPLAKYREGILGSKERPGRGLPPMIVDEDRLRMDFMPFETRTIQDYGVVIDKIHYWHDVLRQFVNQPDEKNPKQKKAFVFRIDPRDISTIWFYDDVQKAYIAIPYRDTSRPAISLWEWREARKKTEEAGRTTADEEAIFAAYAKMREIESQAQAATKSTRRAATRRKMGLGATSKTIAPHPVSAKTPPPMLAIADIQPFDEMDDLLP